VISFIVVHPPFFGFFLVFGEVPLFQYLLLCLNSLFLLLSVAVIVAIYFFKLWALGFIFSVEIASATALSVAT